MNQDIKRKWIEALRSGDYQQGKGAMARLEDSGEYSYCCLGVLTEICDFDVMHEYEPDGKGAWGTTEVPINDVLVKAGLHPDITAHLAHINDSGNSFQSIANYIEEAL